LILIKSLTILVNLHEVKLMDTFKPKKKKLYGYFETDVNG